MMDEYAKDLIDKNINMSVPYYLMASYAYYVEDDAIFSDGFFDNMAKTMLERWDEIEHFHKEYITKDDLEAGTFLGDYPSRVEGALKSLREQLKTVAKPKKPTPTDTMGAFGSGLFDWGE